MFKKILRKYKEVPVTVRSSIWYTICSLVQKSISFLTVPLFTSLLTTAEYGEFSIYQSWFSILIIFTTLTLNGGIFNQAMIEFKNDRLGYISSIQGLVLLLNLLLLGVFLLFRAPIETLIGLPGVVILAMIFEMSFKTSIDFWGGKKRYEYKYQSYVIITILYSLLSTLISLGFVYISKDRGLARILSFSVFSGLFGLIFFFYNWAKGKKIYSKKYWTYALKYSLPLIPYYLSQMIFNQSDRIMIDNMIGKSAAGIYSLAVNLSLVLTFVLNAIEASFLPWFYQRINDGRIQGIRQRVNQLVLIVMSGLLFVLLLAPELLSIMAPNTYSSGLDAMPPVILSLLFLFYVQFFVAILFYYKSILSLAITSIISASVNILLNLLLLPMFGFAAAGYTTLISFILFAIGTAYFANKACKKHLGYSITKLYDLRMFVILALLMLAVMFMMVFLYRLTVIRYLFIALLLLSCLIFHKKIIQFLKTALNKGE